MIEKRISDWIDSHRDEFLRDVARMVAIESVGGKSAPDAPFGPGPRAALDEMLKLCGEYGFATDIYHGAMGSADYNGKAARLDILGHLDVVGPGDGWDTDPYKATLKDDGCLYGRGTDDDKGPVVEALYAMRCLKELGIELEHGCRLLFGTDEETGSGDLHYYYDEHEPAPNTFTPDTGFPVYNVEKGMYRPVITRSWPGEAGQSRLVSAQGGFRINVVPAEATAVIEGLDAPGALKFAGPCADKCGVELIASDTPAGCEILVRGKQTHAAYPQSGINAVTALLAVISELPLAGAAFEAAKELSRLFPHGDWLGEGCGIAQSDEISGELTISADIFELDETGLKLECDSRVPICADEANCREALERRAREAGFEVTGGMIAAHHTPGDGEFVQSLLKCYEHYTGLKGECVSTGGGTYVHDIPGGVGFGSGMPGFDSRLHGANERIRVTDALTASKIFALAIYKICKGKEE
ncbi:MAG TPA: Sapep family Mn(2+)-dependent dipeptidase [Candidatus Scatomorpha gallistercoris]|nr:Sapep family Mn(2+)-dependent dipeptidase [Candidatus Scatomorpha gallistercoris]